jgi:hypothetical protein
MAAIDFSSVDTYPNAGIGGRRRRIGLSLPSMQPSGANVPFQAKAISALADLSGSLGMNRYLVFTYYAGRALGGMKDYLDSFETIDEALENLLAEPNRYFQIVDRDSLRTVREGLAIFKDIQPQEYSDESPSDDWEP